LDIIGANETPVVTGPSAQAVLEGGSSTLNALANASDPDGGTLQIVGLPSILPAGVSFDPKTNIFTLDGSAAAYQSLAVGQTAVVSVTYGVSDGFETVLASVSWTVTGTNDAPAVSPDSSPQHPLIEISGVTGGSGAQTVAGTLAFADVDLADTHDPIATLEILTWARSDGSGATGAFPPTTLAALQAGVQLSGQDSTGVGSGLVGWTFSHPDALFDFLADNEKLTITYRIGVSDGEGGLVTQPVTIVVTGANDGPVFSAGGQVTGSTEDPSTHVLTIVGESAFADADRSDGHAVSVSANPLTTGNFGTLIAGVLADTTGTGTGGSVGWAFEVDLDLPEFRALAEGEIRAQSFILALGDDKGATTTQTITLNLVGENDAPEVGVVTGAATEDQAPVQLDALANAADVDHGAVLQVVDVPSTLPQGVSFDVATHSFTLDPSNAAYQHLRAGQTMTVTVAYGVSDGFVMTPASVSWTVTGANDAPVASPVNLGAIAEEGSRLIPQAELLAGVTDVDGPGLAVTALAIQSGGGTLVSNGDGTWTYIGASDANGAVVFAVRRQII
jgi:VCBS repeat-containing protein